MHGHDLKFIKELYPYFEKEYELTIQELSDYMNFNIKEAKKLLKMADSVWCEWLLLTARWYSQYLYPHQKLFIRAHRFEINRKYGYGINWNKVTKIITVSYYYYEKFIKKFNIPRDKVTVIANYVSTKKYEKPKNEGNKYNIALIGALPSRKGLSKAIDILIELKKKNNAYKLFVPGKRPEEMSLTWNNMKEREYYLQVYKKIKDNNLEETIIFNGWVEISEFLKDIGYVLSVSDAKEPESFHLAPFEGMASGSIGLATKWEGIEYIYPEYCIFNNLSELVNVIEKYNKDSNKYEEISKKGKEFVAENYDIEKIAQIILKYMFEG